MCATLNLRASNSLLYHLRQGFNRNLSHSIQYHTIRPWTCSVQAINMQIFVKWDQFIEQ